jgi:hypothetical protein
MTAQTREIRDLALAARDIVMTLAEESLTLPTSPEDDPRPSYSTRYPVLALMPEYFQGLAQELERVARATRRGNSSEIRRSVTAYLTWNLPALSQLGYTDKVNVATNLDQTGQAQAAVERLNLVNLWQEYQELRRNIKTLAQEITE